MRFAYLCTVAAVGLSGCSSPLFNQTKQPESSPNMDDAADSGDAPLDSGFLPQTRRVWGLTGQVVLHEGAIDRVQSHLSLEIRERQPPCIYPLELAHSESLTAPVSDVYLWFKVDFTVESDSANPCTYTGEDVVYLGFGATDPSQAPAADRAGITLAKAKGFWLSNTAESAWLVGLFTEGAPPPASGDDTDTSPEPDTGASADTGSSLPPPDTGSPADSGEPTETDTPNLAFDGTWQLVMLSGVRLGP